MGRTDPVIADAAEVIASDEHRDDLPVRIRIDVACSGVVVVELLHQRFGLTQHSAVGRSRARDVELRAVHVVVAVRVVAVATHFSEEEQLAVMFSSCSVHVQFVCLVNVASTCSTTSQ